MTIREYIYFPDISASIVGSFQTGQTVTIEVWSDGQAVSITSGSCSEVGTTGIYSWSLSNIASISEGRVQYHWRMSDGLGNTVEGDFILRSYESQDGGMPSLSSMSEYIV